MVDTELVVDIRWSVDKDTGQRYAQYRVRGAQSLVWVPMGEHVAAKAVAERKFLGMRVEQVLTEGNNL
jgi:hypothetical protein